MFRYIALATLAGLFLPLQSLLAARMAVAMNSPMLAALVNFTGGALALILLIVVFRVAWPSAAQAASVPGFAWVIGLFGAFFVAQAAFTVPKLGAAGMTAVVIGGQMVGSVVLDHFGILQPVQPVTLQKLFGALLLFVGVYLILRPSH